MTKLEGMTNIQMTNDHNLAFSSFGLRVSFVIRHSSFVICWSVVLMIVQMCCGSLAQAQSPNVSGTWTVEITFGAGGRHSLRFDAQAGGKGTFVLLDPIAKAWGTDKASEATWTTGEGNSVMFSGPMEFPIGNVGRDAGRLVCKGKFETESSIAGEVDFSPLVGDRPSKSGTFKAIRAAGGK